MGRRDANWLTQELRWAWVPGATKRIDAWVRETPGHEVADLILTVLRRQQQDAPGIRLLTFLFMFFTLGTSALLLRASMAGGAFAWHIEIAVLCPSLFCWLAASANRIIYQRVTLRLAAMNDERAILYLLQCYNSRLGTEPHGAEESLVGDHLIRLLTQTLPTGTQPHVAEALCDFARRHLFGREFRTREVTEAQADLFLCVVRYLAAHGHEKKLLEHLAALTVVSPNAQLVVDAAHYALTPTPFPVISPQASVTQPQVAQPIQQVIHRSS